VQPQGDDGAELGARAGELAPPGDAVAVAVPHKPPAWAPLTLVAFVGLVVCTNIANVVWARWANEHPGGLLALSSRMRYLVLAVTGGISPTWYIMIGFARIAVAFVVCHLVGRAYREQALSWFTRYLGVRQAQLTSMQRGFDKAELGLVPFFAGSNIVAVLTGVHRTRPLRLAVLLSAGIVGRLILVWFLSKAFEDPLLDVLSFLQRYQWWLLAASLVVVVLANVRNFRRGAGS
jgi:hypothetical protein